MSPERIGKFEVLADLGAGAGSHVFHIRRADDGRMYALKVVQVGGKCRKYLEQVRQEFRVGQMLDHPNLIKVHACETEKDWLVRPKRAKLLLEYARGQTMDRFPPPGLIALVRVFAQVADALAHMHERGVCHADLKPENLIIGPKDRVKVIDYGLAWIKGEPKNRVQGTPEYMAPETMLQKRIDEQTDVFNFGATMYRLVTFRPLPVSLPGLILDERSYRQTLVPVSRMKPDAPSELCDLIHWCIEYRAASRPERMSEVRDILKALDGG